MVAAKLLQISKEIKESRPDHSLQNFSRISIVIQKATGMLPTKVIPKLQALSHSYSKTTMRLRISFADIAAILSKFVIKTYRAWQLGMTNNDLKALANYCERLKTDFIKQTHEFVESSRLEMVEIHKALLPDTRGKKVEQLFIDKEKKEAELIQRAAESLKKSSQYGELEGKIESLRYKCEVYENSISNAERAKEEMDKELKRLKAQIPEYEEKILEHRDTTHEERGSFLFFSWKVRDVHNDNGEKIARESFDRLLKRIRELQEGITTWSNEANVERVAQIKANLSIYEQQKLRAEDEVNRFQNLYETDKKLFDKIIEEIHENVESLGTVSIESMKMVDELCRSIHSGDQSIQFAYGKVRTHLQSIDIDPDFLVPSALAAIQFLNMVDTYMGTTAIANLKRVLEL